MRGIINNIMYKNSPGGVPGGSGTITMSSFSQNIYGLIDQSKMNQTKENLSRNTINDMQNGIQKNKNETTI